MGLPRGSWVFALAAALFTQLLSPRPSAAGAGLDVERWLDKTGVQLLAVEFYAT